MIKISDFKNESSLDLFVQQIIQKKTNKYVAPVFKSLKEGIIENFFFNVLDNFYYLVQLGVFLTELLNRKFKKSLVFMQENWLRSYKQ